MSCTLSKSLSSFGCHSAGKDISIGLGNDAISTYFISFVITVLFWLYRFKLKDIWRHSIIIAQLIWIDCILNSFCYKILIKSIRLIYKIHRWYFDIRSLFSWNVLSCRHWKNLIFLKSLLACTISSWKKMKELDE
jgi:hypothetical protein